MARSRWLILVACVAALRLLPACNTCGGLNPQPEPPGSGCSYGDMAIPADSGRASADAGTDANVDGDSSDGPGATSRDGGADQREDSADAAVDGLPQDAALDAAADADGAGPIDAER